MTISKPPKPTRETFEFLSPDGNALRGHFSYLGTFSDPVVGYVHGFGGTRSGEKATALEQAAHRRGWTFVAFDFLGHGDSEGAMLHLRCDKLLSNLEGFRGHLAGRQVERVFLMGSSMGGWAVSWFSQRNPDFVRTCVLLAPAFYFPHTLWTRLSSEQREEWKRSGKLAYHNEWVDVELSYELLESAAAFSLAELTARWETPTLVFHGMKDELVPYADTVHLIEKIGYPNVELRLLRDGDHRLTAHKEMIMEEACRFFSMHV
ncbi:MAG: alpha/beta hydrolase [Gemmataceae bacterium]